MNEYIYDDDFTFFGGVVLYDLETEEMLVYSDQFATTYNKEFYAYLIKNNYQVGLSKISDYVEGHVDKQYYSLEEIKALEPQIEEGLRIINKAKVKTK